MVIPKYYNTEDDFKKIHQKLKLYMCPFCRLFGYLILHGYLKGYYETGTNQDFLRGHRIFCSNRKKRGGCGKTVSILLANILKNFIITADTLWKFIRRLLEENRIAEILKGMPILTKSIGYRLKRLFCVNQTSIRTKLCIISSPPDNKTDNPVIQTIQHLQHSFAASSQQLLCPVSAFQLRFQSSFFKHHLPKSGLL